MGQKKDRWEEILSWMDEAKQVKKVLFHRRLKQAFAEIYEKANGYEVFFIIPGEVCGDRAFYCAVPLIISQTCTRDEVVFHELPPQAWWCFGHTHPADHPKLSDFDQIYCAHIGILCSVVITRGRLTDICRFYGGETPFRPEVEWIDGPFDEKPRVEIPALPYHFLKPLPKGKEVLNLIVRAEEKRIVVSGE